MEYRRELDGLRGLAVLLVLVSHLPLIAGVSSWALVKDFASAVRAGYLGVDLFFVLSGFLITRTLLVNNQSDPISELKIFFYKRFLRILPVYYLCIAYAAVFLGVSGVELISNLTFTSNYFYSFDSLPSPLRHTWSLAVEEQFYLVWPLLVLFAPRSRLGLATIAVGIGVPLLFCIGLLVIDGSLLDSKLMVKATPVRMLSLAAGAWLAINYDLIRNYDKRLFLILSLIVFPPLQAIIRFWEVPIGSELLLPIFTGWSVSIFMTVLLSAQTGQTSLITAIFQNSMMVYIGKISYGLYLYHLIVLHQLGIRDSYQPNGVAIGDFFFGVIVFTVLAIISFHVFERPILRLKNRASARAYSLK